MKTTIVTLLALAAVAVFYGFLYLAVVLMLRTGL